MENLKHLSINLLPISLDCLNPRIFNIIDHFEESFDSEIADENEIKAIIHSIPSNIHVEKVEYLLEEADVVDFSNLLKEKLVFKSIQEKNTKIKLKISSSPNQPFISPLVRQQLTPSGKANVFSPRKTLEEELDLLLDQKDPDVQSLSLIILKMDKSSSALTCNQKLLPVIKHSIEELRDYQQIDLNQVMDFCQIALVCPSEDTLLLVIQVLQSFFKENDGKLLIKIPDVLDTIIYLLHKTSIGAEDSVLIPLVFLCLSLFNELNNNFPLIQLKCSDILLFIFSHCVRHRMFILNEILSNLMASLNNNNKKVWIDKTNPNCLWTLSNGKQIHVISYLLLYLVQSSCLVMNKNEENDGINGCTYYLFHILRFMFHRSGKKKKAEESLQSEYLVIFEGFIVDVLNATLTPELPICFLNLSCICKALFDSIEDMDLKLISIELLGRIFSNTWLFSKNPEENPETSLTRTDCILFLNEYLINYKLLSAKSFLNSEHPAEYTLEQNTSLPSKFGIDYEKIRKCLFILYYPFKHYSYKEYFLKKLLHFSYDSQICYRAKSLKVLSSLVMENSTFLNSPIVQKTLLMRLSDKAIMVREASIDLIGKYFLCEEQVSYDDIFYDAIVSRLLDLSVSIRKKVIRILLDVYKKCRIESQKDRLIDISLMILLRSTVHTEEETVKALSSKVMAELWLPFISIFESSLHSQCRSQNDWQSVLSFQGFDDFLLKNKKELSKLIDIISTTSSVSLTAEDLVSEFFLKVKRTFKYCVGFNGNLYVYVLSIFQEILRKNFISSHVTVLKIISHTSPHLLSKHVDLLTPLLYVDDKKIISDSIKTIFYTLSLFKTESGLIYECGETQLDPELILKIESKMYDISLKHADNIVQSSVQCLCYIVENLTYRFETLDQFLKQLFEFLTEQKKNAKNIPTLCRAIFIIGLFCRYLKAETLQNSLHHLKTFCDGGDNTCIIDNIYSIIMEYSSFPPFKSICISSLGFLFIGYPKYVLRQETKSKLDEYISDKETRYQGLLLIYDFLSAENNPALNNINIDNGIGTSLVQKYLKHILLYILSNDGKIQNLAFEIINIALQYGMVHPLKCIPYIIVVECCGGSGKSKGKAIALHKELDEKHSSILYNIDVESINLIYQYLKQFNDNPEGFVDSDNQNISLFASVYDLVKEKRKRRKELCSNLIKLFEKPFISSGFDVFLAELISTIEYKSLEEVILIITELDRIISLMDDDKTHCLNVCESLKEYLCRAYGLTEAKIIAHVYNNTDGGKTKAMKKSTEKASFRQYAINRTSKKVKCE